LTFALALMYRFMLCRKGLPQPLRNFQREKSIAGISCIILLPA
ncbi:hypothetical protein RvY_11765, partial [Ramazzottius varieornatus]